MVDRDELIAWCDERLRASAFQDVAENGLQVAGASAISKLAVAVSTSRYTLSEAASWSADALLVHHGLLWSERIGPVTGIFAERLRLLFTHDMNLIAYHLPLDGHPQIGNCALLCRAAGFEPVDRFAYVGTEPLGVIGEARDEQGLDAHIATLREITAREPVVVGDLAAGPITRAGFLTGSGYSAVREARDAGCQVLVTGDVRESTMAEAREVGIAVVAAGHEATERLGVQALAGELADRFGIETRFIHDPNPI